MENAIILVTIVKDYSGMLVFDITIMSKNETLLSPNIGSLLLNWGILY
jgi:hypothetical protein